MTSVRRRYVDLPHGQVHLVVAGTGRPVVLLHQTPRSSDEYRDVVPALASAGLQPIAVDTPGFGGSKTVRDPTIEHWAAAIADALEQLSVSDAIVVGHHTGGVVAIELAALRPRLVTALVLSSTPFVDQEFRDRPGHGVDDVVTDADGGHLLELWRGRASLYPPDRPDLLERFVRDALTAGVEMSAQGHAVVRAYRMEDRLPSVHQPVLLIGAPEDPYGYPSFLRMREVWPHASAVEIAGGMVPLPDQFPAEYARAIAAFATGRTS